jgi:hypothetical protein
MRGKLHFSIKLVMEFQNITKQFQYNGNMRNFTVERFSSRNPLQDLSFESDIPSCPTHPLVFPATLSDRCPKDSPFCWSINITSSLLSTSKNV